MGSAGGISVITTLAWAGILLFGLLLEGWSPWMLVAAVWLDVVLQITIRRIPRSTRTPEPR